MKKTKIYIVLCLLLIITAGLSYPKRLFADVVSQEISPQSQTENYLLDEVKQLNTDIEDIKNENIRQTIDSANKSIEHADRLIEWTVRISVFAGVIIAVVSLFVGGDITRKWRALNKHFDQAKKNAETTAELAKSARQKGQELLKIGNELKSLQGDLHSSTQTISQKEKKVDDLINKVQTTINSINSLSGTANFISNATPYGSVSPSLSSNIVDITSLDIQKCNNCGSPLSLLDLVNNDSNVLAIETGDRKNLCASCRNKS